MIYMRENKKEQQYKIIDRIYIFGALIRLLFPRSKLRYLLRGYRARKLDFIANYVCEC